MTPTIDPDKEIQLDLTEQTRAEEAQEYQRQIEYEQWYEEEQQRTMEEEFWREQEEAGLVP